MKSTTIDFRRVRVLSLLLGCVTFGGAHAAEPLPKDSLTITQPQWQTDTVVTTNWVKRTLTNVVEVWIPTNQFVTEYRTNWIAKVVTNVVDVYKTNWVATTMISNRTVQAVHTNWITAYHTNWQTLTRTNWEPVTLYKTNWLSKTLTNEQTVNATATNRVTAFKTNFQSITLTNWETVVQLKTNWVNEKVTRVVEIDMTPARAAQPQPVAATANNISVASAAPAPAAKDVLELEALRIGISAGSGEIGVQLKVRLAGDSTAPLQVIEWRVEREDAPVVFIVKETEFKRALPLGSYLVEVKARRDAAGPLLSAKGRLEAGRETVLLKRQDAPLAAAR